MKRINNGHTEMARESARIISSNTIINNNRWHRRRDVGSSAFIKNNTYIYCDGTQTQSASRPISQMALSLVDYFSPFQMIRANWPATHERRMQIKWHARAGRQIHNLIFCATVLTKQSDSFLPFLVEYHFIIFFFAFPFARALE